MKETSAMPAPSLPGGAVVLDDRIRGFPAGHAPVPLDEIGRQGWKPFDGRMSLPLISLTGFITGIVFTNQSRPSLAEFGAT